MLATVLSCCGGFCAAHILPALIIGSDIYLSPVLYAGPYRHGPAYLRVRATTRGKGS